MALVACRECNERVSTEAASCPKCGVPDPSGRSAKTGRCLGCGKDITVTSSEPCPHCQVTDPLTPLKATLRARARRQTAWFARRAQGNLERSGPDPSKVIGFSGCAILFLGVFMPIVRAPFMGSLNYFQNGRGDGTLIIALAIIGAAACAADQLRWLWVTAVGSVFILGYTFVNVGRVITEARRATAGLRGTLFEDVGELAVQSIQLQWGWGVLVLGAFLAGVAAYRATVEV